MGLLRQTAAAFTLVMLTILLQCAGMSFLIDWARIHVNGRFGAPGRVNSSMLMIRLTSLIVCLHLVEIFMWAVFYHWQCFPAWEPAICFSGGSYSTVGSTEYVLQPEWRTLQPIESLTGILMCGLSASFLFAVVTRLVARDDKSHPHRLDSTPPSGTR